MGVDRRRRLLEEAWVGDAVLGLYARLKILREDGKVDAGRFVAMTSNQFLNAVGEPTSVEAQIGRVYVESGLPAAFEWIDHNLMPIFGLQEAKRLRGK